MLISLLLITIATAGGLAITYLIEKDAPFMWRLAAGNIIGTALFGTGSFVLALAFGLNPATVIAALVIATLPLLVFYPESQRKRFGAEWSRAKSRLQGTSGSRFLRLGYYVFFFLLFFFFFDRAMLESAAGIYTGGSQNLGDLPYHLGAIFSFTEANNFPPQNPSFAGARFSYPFIADLVTAGAVKLGAGVRDAMFVQNLSWAFSLLVILERFVLKLTENRLAARLAPSLLFFSGGLGFIWFFSDYSAQAKSFFDFLSHLPRDYTIGEGYRWGNSMVVLFMTQRSLLLGLPLALIVLGYLWSEFIKAIETTNVPTEGSGKLPASPRPPVSASRVLPFSLPPLIVGLTAGLLPLVHLHSLAALFVVGLALFILTPEKWMTWIAFAAGVAVIAIPELLWSISGSATETAKFFAWHFGWDKGDKNFLWFWLLNTGLVIPLIIAGLYLTTLRKGHESEPGAVATGGVSKKRKVSKVKVESEGRAEASTLNVHSSPLLFFYIPFAFLFIAANVAKLAPWEWDNIKVLIYWFVGSLPFIALAIAWLWRRENPVWKIIAAACFVVLIASGAIDVWRVVSSQINYKVFDADAVEIANQIKVRTPQNALFLNAPTYNSAIVLTGRQSLMRYPGHLGSHGIDYANRESDVKRIYQGGPEAAGMLERHGISYVLISPEERALGTVNEQFFSRYQVAAESGQYRLYKIK